MVLAFTSPEKSLVMGDPAYEAPMQAASFSKAKILKVPLTKNYAHDVKAMVAADPNAGMLYICNPNNPTGTTTTREDIEYALANKPKGSILMVDEAYIHFSDASPVLDLVAADKEIVVLRTFSKIHGLAGLRIGYAVAAREIIEVLHKTRQPFNVNSIAHAGALAALGDEAHLRETKRMVDEGRAYLQEQFAGMRIPFVPAVANFVMLNVGDGCAVFQELLRRKIIVRPLKGYGLPEWVRISVGTMKENKKLIAALSEVIRAR